MDKQIVRKGIEYLRQRGQQVDGAFSPKVGIGVTALDRVRLDNVSQVIVLFDESRVHAASRRAGLLPLVTGLSTIILLTALMTTMTGRLAGRLSKLQTGVEKVADGDFVVADGSTFSAAISNLVLNGLQSATHVQVQATIEDTINCRVIVSDDGPGIEPTVAEQLFEQLCNYFLAKVSDSSARKLSEPLIVALRKRNWSGNVRELRNAIAHAAVLARGKPLQISDFPVSNHASNTANPMALDEVVRHWARDTLSRNSGDIGAFHAQFLAATEPALIQIAIEHAGGNRAKAAELLGIHRGTLRERLRTYGIDESL